MKYGDLLTRGVAEIIDKDSLIKKLNSGRKLRVKFGIDPTSPHLHLGHTVPLFKLRKFQDLGHTAVLIIGDYTALIGDPTGKDKMRPALSLKEVSDNAAQYLKQIGKIINLKKAEIRKNSEWLSKLTFAKMLQLLSHVSVEQIMAHETFRVRRELKRGFGLNEAFYPVMQGYDSIMVKADVELGGVDQKFNLLMGRQLQKDFGQPEQDVMMVSYLLGTDGKKKMGKTEGNSVPVDTGAEDMFGKIMSIPDPLITDYFELLTNSRIPKKVTGPKARGQKSLLAESVTAGFYDVRQAKAARASFDKQFKEHKLPDKVEIIHVMRGEHGILDVLFDAGLTASKSEARRLVKQGAVSFNGAIIEFPEKKIMITGGEVIKVGKRRVVKVRP